MDLFECSSLELTASGVGRWQPLIPLRRDSKNRAAMRIDDVEHPVSTGGSFSDATPLRYTGRKARGIDGVSRIIWVRAHEWQWGEFIADSSRIHPEQLMLVRLAESLPGFLRITSTEYSKLPCHTPVDPIGRSRACKSCGQSYSYDRNGNPSHPSGGAIPTFKGGLSESVTKNEPFVRPRAMLITVRPGVPMASSFSVRFVAVDKPGADPLTHRGFPSWVVEFTRIPSFGCRVLKVEEFLARS